MFFDKNFIFMSSRNPNELGLPTVVTDARTSKERREREKREKRETERETEREKREREAPLQNARTGR